MCLKWLTIGNPISQYTLYAAIFCLLHSSISKEQHKKHLCYPSSHNRKYGRFTRKAHAPYKASISAMSNSYHHIIVVRSVSVIFVSRTEAIMCLPQIITLHGCEERMGFEGSTLMQALQLLWLVKRHILG